MEGQPPPYKYDYNYPIPTAPIEDTSEGHPPIVRQKTPPLRQNMEQQKTRERQTGLEIDVNCNINHCAWGILTFFTSGCCLPCWIGACFGYCPSLNC